MFHWMAIRVVPEVSVCIWRMAMALSLMRRDEVGFDRIGVDAVVELGEGSVEVPGEGEAVVFVVLEALEILDESNFELDRNPGSEFEGNILVGIGSAVASGHRYETDGSGAIKPLFWRESEAVQICLHFNPVEFDEIKIGVVELFPDSKKFDRVAVP